jgi:hypothetical protein
MLRILAVMRPLLKADHAGATDHDSSSLDGREVMTAGEWKQTHDHFTPVVDEIHFMIPYKPNRYLGVITN